jgi:serine/threonine-protein phosphatase 4 regulatory subunit 2
VSPQKHYKTKYLRALERAILVTSTKDTYLTEDLGEDITMSTGYTDNASLRLAMTPVFSPIPSFHDDARRSRSLSPFELAVTRRPGRPAGGTEELHECRLARKGLCLVDEVDDLEPGHLPDDPTALTVATTTPPRKERFVKSSSPESDGHFG